jgi:hypothetical protein
MQREEFRQLVSNPEAMSAMMQIQQGMMRLQATNPLVLNQQTGYVLSTLHDAKYILNTHTSFELFHGCIIPMH